MLLSNDDHAAMFRSFTNEKSLPIYEMFNVHVQCASYSYAAMCQACGGGDTTMLQLQLHLHKPWYKLTNMV